MSFEQALEGLEAIVERIEQGEVGLEESIAEYERGVALIKRCKEILGRAEQRVEELNKQAAGLTQDSDADRR
jgi:exodeoxyribonuclease VII small subunit